MAEPDHNAQNRKREIVFRAAKASIKALILYLVYFILWQFISPLGQLIPGLSLMVEAFIAIYITLMIISDLTSGTIYQHFFNGARALFVILYLIFSMQSGLYGITFENISLTVDVRLFLTVAMTLSLLGFAKAVLQAINFLNQRAEPRTV